MGETGVGKSTLINGFANYLSYATLEEAQLNGAISLIPATFGILNRSCEIVTVRTGIGENEHESYTRFPKTYTFFRKDFAVKLVDAPGILSAQGIETDKAKMQSIIDYVGGTLDELHAVCILVRPNIRRCSPVFQFGITELLTSLHKSACNNIVFCFPHTRKTSFKPGETYQCLRKLFDDNEAMRDLQLTQDTMFCFDNEGVRYLYADEAGVQFDADEKETYADSYRRSAAEVERLLTRIASLAPHRIRDTLTLNDARRMVIFTTPRLAPLSANTSNDSEHGGIHGSTITVEDDEETMTKRVEATAKLAYFLKTNSILPYNDYTEDYLERRICMLDKGNANYIETMKRLEELRIEHGKEEEILRVAMRRVEGIVALESTIDEIEQIMENLHRSKHIRSTMNEALPIRNRDDDKTATSATTRRQSLQLCDAENEAKRGIRLREECENVSGKRTAGRSTRSNSLQMPTPKLWNISRPGQ